MKTPFNANPEKYIFYRVIAEGFASRQFATLSEAVDYANNVNKYRVNETHGEPYLYRGHDAEIVQVVEEITRLHPYRLDKIN